MVNKPFWHPNQSFQFEHGFLKIGSQQRTTAKNGHVLGTKLTTFIDGILSKLLFR